MKKKLILALILGLSLFTVSCDNNKTNTTTPNTIEREESSIEERKRSSDEMYELYTSKLDEVKKLFKENNINFEEKNNDKNNKFDKYLAVVFEDSTKRNPGEISIARYGISFDDDEEIKYISSKIVFYIDENEIKNKEFKFEETEFYKLHNILIPDIKSEEEINEKVNNIYKDLTSIENIKIENGKIKETMTLTSNYISYTIIINP